MKRKDESVVHAVIDGKDIYFSVAYENDLIQREHSNGRFYEPDELDIIRAYFPSGGIFLDVGANVGNHSIFCGRFLSPKRLILIEPNPLVIPILRNNIALNGLSTITDLTWLGFGLSDHVGFADPEGPPENLGATRMLEKTEAGGIRLSPGDELLGTQDIDFIKLDVEGMEMQALKGLHRTIERSRPAIFIEINNNNVAAFHEWVVAQNYTVRERFRRYEANENYMIAPAGT